MKMCLLESWDENSKSSIKIKFEPNNLHHLKYWKTQFYLSNADAHLWLNKFTFCAPQSGENPFHHSENWLRHSILANLVASTNSSFTMKQSFIHLEYITNLDQILKTKQQIFVQNILNFCKNSSLNMPSSKYTKKKSSGVSFVQNVEF